jgi:SAM-dependent methyltransferase
MFDFIKDSAKKYIPTLTMKSVSRASLDLELRRQFTRIKPGIVLDVGSKHSPYKKYISFKKYMRLDIDNRTQPEICSDLQNVEWESNYFDTIIATEVLEHIREPQKAIDEIYRLLKPGGVCILSTRFIHPYHPDPKDYYRFTWDSLDYFFRKFSKTEINHHGNRFQSLWQIICSGKIAIVLNIFNPIFSRVHFKKTRCPCGFVVYAIK